MTARLLKRRGIAVMIGYLATGLLFACAPHPPRTLVDLTYPFGEETIYWPTNKPFQWEKTAWGMTSSGYWYTSADFAASEHGGTHIDAPIHFAQGRSTVDQIPVERLIGPAVVIDVSTACQDNADCKVTVDHILTWEAQHGRIEDDAIVFIRSGWGSRWPDKARYLGTTNLADPRSLHFPGLSQSAAQFLVTERAVRGVGIDTASIDPGQSQEYPAHRVLNSAEVYVLENVAALDRLPPRGATVFALPMKIKGGTGGPVRIVALIP